MKSITIPRAIASQNATMWKHWTAYTKERDAWFILLRSKLIPRHNPPAEKVYATILSRRKRLLDYGNLVGGAKPIPDALKKLGYIVDDNPKWFECEYKQEQTDGAEETILTIRVGEDPKPGEDETPRLGASCLSEDGK